MFVLQIGNTFYFFFLVPGYQLLLQDSLTWFYWVPDTFRSIATRHKLVGFLVKKPFKAHGVGVPVCCVLPASVCFKTLPVPCQACSLLEAAVVLGRARHRGSCWWGLALKPDAALKRRWETRAQLGNLYCEQQSHQWESGL